MNANVNLSYSVNKILLLLFITHADGSRKGVVFAAVLCVCLFFLRDISKADAARITKLDTEVFHHKSRKT